MPHVSKRKISNAARKDLDGHLLSFLDEADARTRQRIFKELLTKTERLMIAKRLAMIILLEEDNSLYQIENTLAVSPSTAARFSQSLDGGAYEHTRTWIKRYKGLHPFLRLLIDLAATPFEARRESFAKRIKRY